MSLAASLSGLLLLSVATASNDDGDFRFISQQDLMASSVRFSVEGVNYFGPLLFDVARDQLFIGARDNLFRLSLRGLHELERVSWPAPQGKVDLCINKGQSEDACRNYVKILLSDGNRLFSCGTTAFAPSCAWRALDNASSVIKWESGVAMCPPDPRANITALFSTEGQYYIGTPTDFSGSDFAVYRALGGGLTLRTNQYNSNWLNEPQFVGSFEDDKFVYFIFREAAVEYMNCGKRVYSRIARVCKNDAGGQTALRDNWTTFVKARLNCSEPGEYPFYYDEIQSIEYLPEERLLYGVFTTPPNSIPGSAVCVFNMSAIEDAFRGSFKYKETSGSAWEGRNSRHHLHTHCPSIARQHEVTEALRYQLLDGAVQASSARPLLTVPRRLSLLTAAGPRVLFTATPEGAVLKLSVLPNGRGACMIEEWQPEVGASPIRSLQYLRETDSVYIATEEAVVRVAAARCGRWTARATCLGAQDPQCGWDERHEQCSTGGPRSQWLQGHPACPVLTGPVDGGWSAWGLWEPCLQGEGDQDRCQCQTRRCDSPTPRGGRGCSGASVRVSNCTVHGAWTAWSGWSACSASCGVAVKWRRRACGAPAPAYGGRLCVGPDREEIYCTQNPPCPAPVIAVAEAGWSDWGPWSSCSAPCGGGARWRNRSCNNPPPSPGGGPCPGCATQAEPCNLQACEVRRASAWTPWIPVHSNSSDNLVEKRYRFSCKTQTADNYLKISLSKEEERPRERGSGERTGLGENTNGSWGAWGGWGDCSAECGGGQQSATRPCLQPPCEGSAHIQRACNTHSCIDGWGCWSEWTECSGSCGAGRSQRRRPCLLAGGCEGASVQTRHCQGSPCYESDGWSEWEEWSACDGGAEQLRRRRCLRAPCLGPDLQSRTCIYDDDGTDNELHALAALSPHIVAAGVQGAEGAGSWVPMMGALVGGLVCGVALATGTTVYMRRRRATRIPSSPHYMTQPNSYTSVPLKEVPKKRQSSFSGTSAGGICPAKANNLNSDRTTPKVFLKSMSGEYESSTMKKNSNAPLRNNINLEQEKFN